MCLLAAGGKAGVEIVAVVIGGVFLVMGLIIFFAWRYEKKRTEHFRLVAQELGLQFFPKGDGALQSSLRHFHLFSQGRSQTITNLLHGETNAVELAIFDYRYVVGGGKNSQTHHQSVIYFRSPRLHLPKFSLRPEGLFHKIGAAFGYQDMDFDTHPSFSKSYLLRSDDEPRTRELFCDELLTYFESQNKICVEGSGDQLVFYRQAKRIKPEEIRSLMEEGFQVFTRLRTSDA